MVERLVCNEEVSGSSPLRSTMKKPNYFLASFISAAGVFIYVTLIAWLGFNNQTIFGRTNNFLMPLFILLLFVISASITGLLVLGKPIHLYLNGLKKEAFVLLFATVGWLAIFLIVVATILLLQ